MLYTLHTLCTLKLSAQETKAICKLNHYKAVYIDKENKKNTPGEHVE